MPQTSTVTKRASEWVNAARSVGWVPVALIQADGRRALYVDEEGSTGSVPPPEQISAVLDELAAQGAVTMTGR